ncbi:Caudovirales tail fiber assembly protein [Photorhabdus australis subsp. thailandensis]|uniref:Caudovirales tail fiber assembly protein n=1 Tax=Photorhabdus australis subsp. thailandensis TaxID=2805096 RepID=A0A1C0U9N3_9GAMM|nr:tail fiber assembly protein [Photorhabdus australis]OCQ54639.1 Caudovirales tail fiber assembly protein [Photorhabdus australis subsp. thailandensis]
MAEQKYSLEHETAILGKDRLATQAGWIKVYHSNQMTREFTNADMEYLMLGVSVSAGAYPDAPELPQSHDMAVRRSEDKRRWEIVPDYRGKMAYNTQTRQKCEIIELGELPETLTFKQPATDFDTWDGEKWVTDTKAQKASQIEQAEQQRSALSQNANETVALLQDTVDLDMATEAEKAALQAWKKYRVMLSRVDISQAPNIKWPDQPK